MPPRDPTPPPDPETAPAGPTDYLPAVSLTFRPVMPEEERRKLLLELEKSLGDGKADDADKERVRTDPLPVASVASPVLLTPEQQAQAFAELARFLDKKIARPVGSDMDRLRAEKEALRVALSTARQQMRAERARTASLINAIEYDDRPIEFERIIHEANEAAERAARPRNSDGLITFLTGANGTTVVPQ